MTEAERRKEITKVLQGIEKATEKRIANEYLKALDKIRADLSVIYEKYAKNGILTKTDMSQYNRLNSLEAEIIKVLKPVLKDSWKLIEQERERIYDEAFFRYMWDLEQTGEFSFNYGLFNRDTIKATIEKKDMIENPMDRITKKRLLENGILKVQSTLTQGLIQGIPYNRMAKDIRDSINGNFNDALRIIRTEGQRATT